MEGSQVTIKGTGDGLIIELGAGELPHILREMDEKLGHSASFFRGGRVALRVGPRILNRDEIEALGTTLYKWGVTLWAVESDAPETRAAADSLGLETGIRAVGPMRPATPAGTADVPDEDEDVRALSASEGLLLRRTLRSGASIVHRGHVVVIGDVNPGAEVIAGGDVVVWGKLRGLAHAGAGGDEKAVVCALLFTPEQVRISDKAAALPRGQLLVGGAPQMAMVREGQIVFESWLGGAMWGETRRRPLGRARSLWRRLVGRREKE